jgi:hypothetical protein
MFLREKDEHRVMRVGGRCNSPTTHILLLLQNYFKGYIKTEMAVVSLVSSLYFFCCLLPFQELILHEENIRDGGKTVQVVFKYIPRSLL